MKHLEYIGDLYYCPHHDFVGNLHFDKKTALAAFLYGTRPLEELRRKKIVLWGTGEHSLWCKELLSEQGLTVAEYCDNDPAMVGRQYRGKVIHSPFDFFDSEQYHLIAVPDDEKFEDIADQLRHNGVEHYSYFFHTDTVIDFKEKAVRTPVMKALNCLINNEYDSFIHKNDPMGITRRLLPGLEWWSQELYWLCEDMPKAPAELRVLDIGPGFGFVSLIIKLLRPDCDLRWLSMGLEDRRSESYIDPTRKNYPIIQYHGMVEDPAYQIEGSYDAIIMTEVFEHFGASPAVTLQKIGQSLKPEGRIYLSTPNWEKANMYRSWRDIPPFPGDREAYAKRNKSRVVWMDLNMKHTYIYTEQELLELFEESGLKVERFVLNDCNNFNFVLGRK